MDQHLALALFASFLQLTCYLLCYKFIYHYSPLYSLSSFTLLFSSFPCLLTLSTLTWSQFSFYSTFTLIINYILLFCSFSAVVSHFLLLSSPNCWLCRPTTQRCISAHTHKRWKRSNLLNFAIECPFEWNQAVYVLISWRNSFYYDCTVWIPWLPLSITWVIIYPVNWSFHCSSFS